MKKNEAVYTAYVTPRRPNSESIAYIPMDGPMDRPMDGQTLDF